MNLSLTFTFSNFLSALRGPLALFFLYDNSYYRAIAIVLAMLTDFLDGFLARRFNNTTQLGAFLDPMMDKFFVIFSTAILMKEGSLKFWELLAIISRDFAVFFFGINLALCGIKRSIQFRSIWFGKISTTLQFFVLLGLTFHFLIPSSIYVLFMFLGILSFLELYYTDTLSN